jgi:2-keto-4-pentenoate hydratase/2-oxohepta-3-ene-1,7-dioic acid hydratase in catechol pathway
MKLVTFTTGRATRIGVVVDDGVLDLSLAAPELPRDMIGFLQAGEEAMGRASGVARKTSFIIPLDRVRLEAPVPRPGKFLCLGGNYQVKDALRGEVLESVKELQASINHQVDFAGMRAKGHQLWANKQVTCVTGPFDPIKIPRASDQVIYETELAFVIGRRCSRVSAEEATRAIAGYLICNDVTTVDWSLYSPTVTLGKSFDTHGPIGPWIVTPEEIGNPHTLEVRTYILGERRHGGSTADMLIGCYDMVAYLSQTMTLEPGDILTTGTSGLPSEFLNVGDVVRCEIDRIGYIENAVVKET